MGSISFDLTKIDTKEAEDALDQKQIDLTFKCQLISHLYHRHGTIEISDIYDESYLFNMNVIGVQGKELKM